MITYVVKEPVVEFVNTYQLVCNFMHGDADLYTSSHMEEVDPHMFDRYIEMFDMYLNLDDNEYRVDEEFDYIPEGWTDFDLASLNLLCGMEEIDGNWEYEPYESFWPMDETRLSIDMYTRADLQSYQVFYYDENGRKHQVELRREH